MIAVWVLKVHLPARAVPQNGRSGSENEYVVTRLIFHAVASRGLGFNLGSSISIFGLGYVGSVTAACFAHMGHRVAGIDVSRSKVEMLESGKSPVLEAGMAEMVAEGIADAIRGSEVVIVATKEVDRDTVRQCLAPEQIVIDLVN